MARKRQYPSEHEKCEDLSGFLRVVRGLRSRWSECGLPAQKSGNQPQGEEKALWFRGQSDMQLGLVPKIWRNKYKKANEAEMRLEFMSVGHSMTDGGGNGDDWYWYFLMQHYGCPTRLLDWTTNPLVALYFAARSANELDAAVWILDPWRWNQAHVKGLYGPAIPGWQETKPYLLKLEDAFDTETDERQTSKKWPITIEPPDIDRRIAAQGSKFVLFGNKKDMLDSPAINRERDDRGKHAIIDRIIIPYRFSVTMLSELNNLGINQRSLFPDLEGLGHHIEWEWKFPSGTEALRTNIRPRRQLMREKGQKNPLSREKAKQESSSSILESKSIKKSKVATHLSPAK